MRGWIPKLVVVALAAVAAVVLYRGTATRAGDSRSTSGAREITFLRPGEPVAPPTSVDSFATAECNALLRGRFVDRAGAGIAGVRLASSFPVAETTSAADGSFVLALLLPQRAELGALHLSASAVGFANARWPVELRAEATIEIGPIVLDPGGVAVGRVVDEHGRALAHVAVRCSNALEVQAQERFHGPALATAEGATDGDGRFRVVGVPLGLARAWAGTSERYWEASEVFDVAAGRESLAGELTLHPIPPEHLIEVHVVAPDGAPVAGAELTASTEAASVLSDVDGVCRVVVETRGPRSIRVTDPSGRWRGARVDDVRPGAPALVVVLREPRTLRVVFRGVDAQPIAVEHVELAERGSAPFALGPGHGASGVFELALPLDAFELRADAAGFVSQSFGPFEPDALGAELALALRPWPVLRGVVRSGAAPVRGARVSLCAAVAAGTAYEVDGFPSRYERRATASSVTDARGEFALSSNARGRFWLRCESDSLAPSDIGPLDLDGSDDVGGLALELVRGGLIEGVVTAPAGGSVARSVVALSRGDGHPRSVRADAEGRFRFERLTPGAWWVGTIDAPLPTESEAAFVERANAPRELASTCSVRDRETTRVEVPVLGAEPALVRGRLALDGAALDGWHAALITSGRNARELESSALAADGTFELRAPFGGSYTLQLHSAIKGPHALWISAPLRLVAGSNLWALDLPLGRAQGRVTSGIARTGLTWRWRRDDGVAASGTLEVDERGTFVVPRMPAGTIEFVRALASGEELLERVELPARATLDLEL